MRRDCEKACWVQCCGSRNCRKKVGERGYDWGLTVPCKDKELQERIQRRRLKAGRSWRPTDQGRRVGLGRPTRLRTRLCLRCGREGASCPSPDEDRDLQWLGLERPSNED